MANTKTYSIVINGVNESIKAVDSLSDALSFLEQRMKAVQASAANVGGSKGSSRTSALKEEDALLKQIQKSEQELINVQREEYQSLLANKDLIKQAKEEAQQRAAQERIAADTYANSMEGIKQKLADIKKVMQTQDIGSERFKEMTKTANELNSKLLEVEKSYGQFGRQVGNYEIITQGLEPIKIKIGDVEREFASAREASRTLANELKTMAVNGEQDTKAFKDMQKAVAQLNSDIKDATVSSVAMDNALDALQSAVSVGQVTQGFSALLGFDDEDIEKSIQKLVALQNAMQGLEAIQQQLNSGEGLGKWLSKGSEAADKLAQSMLGANKASKVLSIGLKGLGIGLVISAIMVLIDRWEEIYKWFTDTIPALKNLSTWFKKVEQVAYGVGNVIANWILTPIKTLALVIQAFIEKRFKDIGNIIGKGLIDSFNVAKSYQDGANKAIENQNERHNKKLRDQNLKALEERKKDEDAKYGQSLKRDKEYWTNRLKLFKKGSEEYKEAQRKLWETERKMREQAAKKSAKTSKTSKTSKNSKTESEVVTPYQKMQEEMDALYASLYKDQAANQKSALKNAEKSRLNSIPIPRLNPNDATRNLNELKLYYQEIADVKIAYNKEYERLDQEALKLEKRNNESGEDKRYRDQLVSLRKSLDEKKITQEQYDKLAQDAAVYHFDKELQIQADYNTKSQALTQANADERKKIIENSHKQMEDSESKMLKSLSQQVEKSLMENKWGFVNLGKLQKHLDDLKAAYSKNIDETQKLLDKAKKDGNKQDEEYYGAKLAWLKAELKVQDEQMVKGYEKNIQTAMQYAQIAMQSFMQLMSSIWDYQDYEFEKEQNQLDKWNEELDKKLEEQQEIVQEHSNNINSIEDELSTARGDRRQHLIDQLNAEVAAKRAAKQQEDKIQKQKEAAEKKQEALDKKRRQEEYKRNLIAAFVSWHLAIANGLATKPFLPLGIAMGALAGTLGAIQFALIASQKPYRYGGQLEGGLVKGKRHTQGGVPVGNTGIEVEGDEMIIRRESTMPNVDLLEYINNSQKKLTLDDFIDYYSNGKVKKSLTSANPTMKFAQGGQVPTLSNINVNDRLTAAFEEYAQRPIYVAVTEIEKKQASLNRVRVLAGLTAD